MKLTISVVLVLMSAFAFSGATLGAEEKTLTGSVGDAMCGAKHMMDNGTACTKGCVKKGSDFALIVDDKAYTLKTSSDEAKDQLGELAGKMAMVTGDVTGDTIAVASVKAAE